MSYRQTQESLAEEKKLVSIVAINFFGLGIGLYYLGKVGVPFSVGAFVLGYTALLVTLLIAADQATLKLFLVGLATTFATLVLFCNHNVAKLPDSIVTIALVVGMLAPLTIFISTFRGEPEV